MSNLRAADRRAMREEYKNRPIPRKILRRWKARMSLTEKLNIVDQAGYYGLP